MISLFNRFRDSPILRAVAVYSFLFIFTISTLLSLEQEFREVRFGEKQALDSTDLLLKIVKPELESAIWEVDRDGIRRILTSIIGAEQIASAKVVATGIEPIELTDGQSPNWLHKDYPLAFYDGQTSHQLGTLSLELSNEEIVGHFWSGVGHILWENTLRFLLVVMLMMWVIEKKVRRPIEEIQLQTKKYSESQLAAILGTSEVISPPRQSKELEALREDIQQLQDNFQAALEKQKEMEAAQHETALHLERERERIRLLQRLDTIGSFTSQVIHDLGNLLMIVDGSATAIEKHAEGTPQHRHAKNIGIAVERAKSLISKLLTMSRIQPTQKSLFSPATVVREAEDLLRIAVGRPVTVNVVIIEEEATIFADANSFGNALLNLCVNARDAMPKGGQLTIEVRPLERLGREFVTTSVSDTGTGIPKEIRHKIFTPFFTTKGPGSGSGLGLAQVKDFVDESGGSIDLESSEHGTKFTLLFPREYATAEESHAGQQPSAL